MDNIRVSCEGNDKIAEIIAKNSDVIMSEVLCGEVVTTAAQGITKEWSINNEKVVLGVEKM